jgi:hypothetical protein
MPFITKNCLHIDSQGDLSIIENVIAQKETFDKCADCDHKTPDLWLCLYPDCRYVGCDKHHHEMHYCKLLMHSVYMNLSTNQIWCYYCEAEIPTVYVSAPPQSPSMNELKTFSNKYAGDGSVNIDCKPENYDFQRRFVKK